MTTLQRGTLGGLALTLFAGISIALAAPTITITEGPADGSTVSAESVTFAFSTEAASTTRCSIVGADDADSFFSCGSPQTYELPSGEYRFSVEAADNAGATTTVSRTFTMDATVSDDDDEGGGGDSSDDAESEPRPRRSAGGSVRYQTPIVVGQPLVAIRPNTSTIAQASPAATVVATPTTGQVAGQSTVAPRTTAVAPRTTAQATPRTTTAVSTPAATTTATTTTAATSTPTTTAFATVPAGASAGLLNQGGVPNWAWALVVLFAVLGIGGYAYAQSNRV